MRRFAALFAALDETNRTRDKLSALVSYFSEVPPEDGIWALHFLLGRKSRRVVTTTELRAIAAEAAGVPLWLVEECYEAVGDLAETLALLLPESEGNSGRSLRKAVGEDLSRLKELEPEMRAAAVKTAWASMGTRERLVWNKCMTGGFRVGVAKTLVQRALAQVAEVTPAEMAHRLMGDWQPEETDLEQFLSGRADGFALARPYPFYLAYPLEQPPNALGAPADWQAEWKWDGIRAQIVRRGDELAIWSRGEELLTGRFPALVSSLQQLPAGTVLDGEILAWQKDRPLPFGILQRRIGRKTVTKKLLEEAPVAFMAYDLLEAQGEDIRERPLAVRRELLEKLFAERAEPDQIMLSAAISFSDWDELAAMRSESRSRAVEGLMLKRLDSPYLAGRRKGDWWKWKVEPYTIDAVMIYAQRGHGRRASLYTDYSFAVWHEGELVPIAKAYSGLSDAEIRRVDRFVRRNTRDRFGPVRVVEPTQVFELAFEGLQRSTRHKSGIALRFPRMKRWRTDKKAEDADTLETVRELLPDA